MVGCLPPVKHTSAATAARLRSEINGQRSDTGMTGNHSTAEFVIESLLRPVHPMVVKTHIRDTGRLFTGNEFVGCVLDFVGVVGKQWTE